MSDRRRGIIIYGHGSDAVAQALRDLDPLYVPTDHPVFETGQVPVLRRRNAAEADAARDSAPGASWLVVELYQSEDVAAHARAPVLTLNTSKVDPRTAARAIDQPHLVTWYEIINPLRVTTADDEPVADDYSNITLAVPDGHRMVAHAVAEGGTPPACLQGAARVLPSHDLWALAPSRGSEVCPACLRTTARSSRECSQRV